MPVCLRREATQHRPEQHLRTGCRVQSEMSSVPTNLAFRIEQRAAAAVCTTCASHKLHNEDWVGVKVWGAACRGALQRFGARAC